MKQPGARKTIADTFPSVPAPERERFGQLIGAFGANAPPGDPRLKDFAAALSFWLDRTPAVVPPAILPPHVFESLSPRSLDPVYWGEIDAVIRFVRARTFQLQRDRLVGILEHPNDPVVVAMHLRQFVELVVWSAFYWFGLTAAYNSIVATLPRVRGGFHVCEPLEEFVRAPLAPSREREVALNEVRGLDTPERDADHNFVDEITATQRKQGAVVRHVLRYLDSVEGTSLEATYKRLESAYFVACGLIHPTPVLFMASEPSLSHGSDVKDVLQEIVAVVVPAACAIAQATVFEERRTVRFWPLFRALPYEEELSAVSVPDFERLKRLDDEIYYVTEDGKRVNIYSRKAGQ